MNSAPDAAGNGDGGGLPVAASWFTRVEASEGITLLVEQHVTPLLRANTWHVHGRERDLVVDTGMGIGSVRDSLSAAGDKPVIAVATHNHFDHTGGLAEFDVRLMHPLDRDLSAFEDFGLSALVPSTWPAEVRSYLESGGYPLPEVCIDALPHAGFDPRRFAAAAAVATGALAEGDSLDLGDRSFSVLHLPGHTPGSIGLFDERSGVLFTGDVPYDGPLLDELPESSIPDYVETMRRLRDLQVQVVHPGHESSFGAERMIALIDEYLAWRHGD